MPSISKSVVLDGVILFIVILTIEFIHSGEPKRTGFFCNDDSIRYPLKVSTVSNFMLHFVGFTLPITIFIVNELVNYKSQNQNVQGQAIVLFGWTISHFMQKVLTVVSIFLFGAFLCILATDFGKYSVGSLRPHFWNVCNPTVNCSDPAQDPHMYVEEYECLGTDLSKIKDSRQSFPSGHASLSAYVMIYTVIYIQVQVQCKTIKFLKPFLQFILLLIAFYTALSRVADHKHHWNDILVGFILGATIAILVAYFISDMFEKDPEKLTLNIIAESSITPKSTATNIEGSD